MFPLLIAIEVKTMRYLVLIYFLSAAVIDAYANRNFLDGIDDFYDV